jgi:hypothetical protein
MGLLTPLQVPLAPKEPVLAYTGVIVGNGVRAIEGGIRLLVQPEERLEIIKTVTNIAKIIKILRIAHLLGLNQFI